MSEIATNRVNLTEFFRELLRESMRAQRVTSSEPTERYLVGVLEQLARAEPGWLEKPFAIEYLESFHAPRAHRVTKLRRVADTTLVLSGLFADSLQRSAVGVEYYMRLGRSAYGNLAGITAGQGPAVGNAFAELAAGFADYVRVLSEISFAKLFPDDRRLLRVYSRWLRTPSQRDAEWLARRGLLPCVAPPERGH